MDVAAANGDIKTLNSMLNDGYYVDDGTNNEWRSTPLMFAAQKSNGTSSLDTVKLLLDRGADINAANRNGYTALMFAAQQSNGTSSLDTVKLLLDRGADINAADRNGYTALMIAAQESNGTSSLDTVKLLLDRGADINAANSNGDTALMFAAQQSNGTSSLDTVKLLLDRGADINAANSNGNTALMIAAQESNGTSSLDTVKLLLDRGADINAADRNGNTALIIAGHNSGVTSSLDAVKLLLDKGANPYINTNYMSENVKNIIHKYQWKNMYNNIKLKARQFSRSENVPEGDLVLPYDVWELILLRQKQQWLCKEINNIWNFGILMAFAEMLEIPIPPENITKAKLCGLISEQLAWGGKYSSESEIYSIRRYNDAKEDIFRLAYRLGIDTHQPINKILDEIGIILQ
jgi:ankyrin repeat protein